MRTAEHQAACRTPDARNESVWWQRATRHSRKLAQQRLETVARYRFGDGLLEIDADGPLLVHELAEQYGECTAVAGEPEPKSIVRCSVRTSADGRLALVGFHEPAKLDAAGIALDLLSHPTERPLYREREATAEGWRVIGPSGGGEPVLAAKLGEVLVDLRQMRPGFLVELVVTPTLSLQRQLLFIHAAGIGIGAAGTLLIGPTGTGKTTLSLALAARGHDFFGDDIAAVRLATAELLPFRRTASMRPGPHARALADFAATECFERATYADGRPRIAVHVSRQFPASSASPLRLRRAFFLRQFTELPAVEPFIPTMGAIGSQPSISLNRTLWLTWGTSPGRRLLQFMLFVQLLSRIPCAFLDAGTPDATADLIEHLSEETWV